MGNEHSMQAPKSRCNVSYEEQINLRMADDGKWYAKADFIQYYPHDWEQRYAAAPQYLERRKEAGVSGPFRNPRYFFDKYGGGGYSWNKNSKPGWENAKPETRLADDGKWYVLQEFQKHYTSDWSTRWAKAPVDDELRYCSEDNMPHNAEYFFRKNSNASYGQRWNLNSKPGWDEARPAPKADASLATQIAAGIGAALAEKRLANDGMFYVKSEFDKFYPGQPEYWDYAPSQNEKRIHNGVAHDAAWFYKMNTDLNGPKWTKNHRAMWDEAKKDDAYVVGGRYSQHY